MRESYQNSGRVKPSCLSAGECVQITSGRLLTEEPGISMRERSALAEWAGASGICGQTRTNYAADSFSPANDAKEFVRLRGVRCRNTQLSRFHRLLFIDMPYRALLIGLGAFLLAIHTVKAQGVVEVGDSCAAKSKLSPSFLCVEGFVINCRSASSRELLYCTASELQKADNELNRLYQRAIKKFKRPNDVDVDYKNALKALIEGQRAWLRFKKADCEILGYLNLKGSIQSNEMVGCELKHTKNRIADINAYFGL